MKTLFALCLLLGTVGRAYSQNYVPYYNLVNEAEYQAYLGKTDLALGLYQKAFLLKDITPKAKDLYLAGKLELERGRSAQAFTYFSMAGPLPDARLSYWFSKSKDYFIKHLDEDVYQQKYKTAGEQEVLMDQHRKPLIDSLNIFLEADQHYRKIFADSIQAWYQKGDPRYDAYEKLVDENDVVNQTRFLAFIKKNGYPGTYLLGFDMAGTILRHIDCGLYTAYREELHRQLLAGKVEPFHYASLVDRIGCICEGKSLYTSAEGCDVEWETMLQNREEIGLTKYFRDPGLNPIRERQLLERK